MATYDKRRIKLKVEKLAKLWIVLVRTFELLNLMILLIETL